MTGQFMRTALPTAAFIGYLLWAVMAFAASPHAEVVVSKDTVTLGDIFEDAGAAADRVVMSAPAAGRSVMLDTPMLTNLARANGIAWQSVTGTDFVKVERASQRFEAAAISDGIIATLHLPAPAVGHTTVSLDNPQLVLNAPIGTPAELSFSSLQLDATGQRFAGLAQIKSGDRVIAQAAVAGRVVSTLDVPVLTRPMRRDEVIGANDITWQPTELVAGNSSVIFNAEDLIGKMPRSGLRPGMPIRMADLVTPALIKRGTQVTMLYQVGRMTITAQGRALNDAAVGEVVRTVNLASSRTVEGVAEGSGVVRIGPAPDTTHAAANLATAPVNVTMN